MTSLVHPSIAGAFFVTMIEVAAKGAKRIAGVKLSTGQTLLGLGGAGGRSDVFRHLRPGDQRGDEEST